MIVAKRAVKNMEVIAYHDLDGKPGFKMAMQQVGDRWYMYLAHLWHPGWAILDVTDPAKPELLRFIDGPENTWTTQVQVAEGLMITSLEKDLWRHDPGKPFGEGAMIWDVRDPVNPRLLSHFHTGGNGTHRNFYTGGRYLYLAATMKGYHGHHFVALDIADPTHPVEVSRWWYPGQWVAGGEKPQYGKYFHGPAYIVGNLAYLGYGRAGMIILDLEDLAKPRMVGRLDIGSFGGIVGAHSVLPLPDRQLAVMTTEANAEEDRDPMNLVLTVDMRDVTKPKPIANFPVPEPPPELGISDFQDRGGRFGPHNIHLPHYHPCLAPVANLIHLCYENAGLWIYDIANPGMPKPVAYFIPEDPAERRGKKPNILATQTEDVLVDSRGYIYITDKNHGLFILRHKPA
jgi:hypothetical protein